MRSLVCARPGALAIEERPRPSLERARCWFGFAAQASAGPIFIFSKVRIRSSNIRGSSGTNCPAKWRTGALDAPSRSASRFTSSPISPVASVSRAAAARRIVASASRVLGVHIDGGMADYVCVPEANVAAADGVTLDQAAMVEFLAIGAHAVRRARSGPATAFWSSGRDRSGSAACCSRACKAAW